MRIQIIKSAALLLLCGAMMLSAGCKQKQVILDASEPDSPSNVIGNTGGTVNFTLPQEGEDIVILTVRDYGDIKIRLFPEECPKGTENFTKLVESGYYDELPFFRVTDGVSIRNGDPKGNGTGGTDAWGSESGFAQTISGHLCHVTGAVAYAADDNRMNNSQFYIVTGEQIAGDYFSQLRAYNGVTFSPETEQLYQQAGGQPMLDGSYEVFGQVFDGMEYCLDIQKVPVDSSGKPKSAVLIEKAVVTAYDGALPHWLNAAGEEITAD